MNNIKRKWLDALGTPSYEIPKEPLIFVKRYAYEDFDLEVYVQRNDPKSFQRIMMAFPKKLTAPCPAVVVPFYYPEAMLGFDPATQEICEKFTEISMMRDLVKRGYITASADSYHLTYTNNVHSKEGLDLWDEAGRRLREDNPNWSGVGKLVSDTTLLIDAVASDCRVDNTRIGIAGHSLGGKMAFYTGCLDDRIKVILASDFGIGWEQTNWKDIWYWHNTVDDLMEKQMDHAELLGVAAPKPFCLIAGKYDDETSWTLMSKAPGYQTGDGRLKIINHATGHRPPRWALDEGYDFVDEWL
ncbi:MAG: acetylxylan esterase [Clostridia bacterium]|nr:acetylxylan esterase [Clostridia bacterium]